MTIFASIPNTVLIPLIICACVIALFAVMDSIAWIRFKSKQNEPARKAKAAEKAQKAEEARQAKEAEKAKKEEEVKQTQSAEEARNASSASDAASTANSTSNSQNSVMAVSSNSSVNGGDNSANPASSASPAQPVNGVSNATGVVAVGAANSSNSTPSNASDVSNEDTRSSNNAVSNGSTSTNAAFVGGAVVGASAMSAASSVSSESVSVAPEEGTVTNSTSASYVASGVASAGSTGAAIGASGNSASMNGTVVAGGVATEGAASISDDEICTDNGGTAIVSGSTMNNQNGDITSSEVMVANSSNVSEGSSMDEASSAVNSVASYSSEAASVGAIYGVDGVAGHGGFLLFAFLGGDVNKDFYDYYVSPYGDKRRCLYHQNDDGSMRIVFDEALVDGEFFPSDYFEYFDEQDGGRSRVHMIDGVAGEKEDANFADPFASSYDVAAYNEQGQRVLAHYEDGHEINEQVISDPDIALMRDYTYKDGSLVSHLRHNRLAEQNSSKKEENKPMEQTIEEKPITKEAVAESNDKEESKKAYERRASFAEKLSKADGLLRSRYEQIHAEMEAYGIHSRLSVPCDTYSLHRQDYLKITIDGKSMKLFFHLSPKDYEKTTIPCEDASDKKTYVDTPLLLHITSGLSVRRALALIADMMAKAGISKKEKK